MTVAKLMAQLSQFDMDLEVIVDCCQMARHEVTETEQYENKVVICIGEDLGPQDYAVAS